MRLSRCTYYFITYLTEDIKDKLKKSNKAYLILNHIPNNNNLESTYYIFVSWPLLC